MMQKDKKKPEQKISVKEALGRMAPRLRPYYAKLLIAMLLALLASALSVVGPKLMGNAVTKIFTGLIDKVRGTGGIDFAGLLRTLMLLLGLYLISSIGLRLQGILTVDVAMDFSYRLSDEISRKIHRMPLKYFEKHAVGDTLSLISNDVDLIRQNLSETVIQSVSGIATILGVIVMMLSISPLMTGLVVLIVPLSGLLMGLIFGRSQKYFTGLQEQLGEINGHVEETYSGQSVIQLFGREKQAMAAFEDTNGKLYESAWKSQFLSGLMMPLMEFVGNLGFAAVTIAGAMLAIKGRIALGDITAFTSYVRQFMRPIAQIAQMSSQIQALSAASDRVMRFLDEEEEVEKEGATRELVRVKGAVEFDHVRFGYEPDKPVIHDFTCSVSPGQKIALVGQTGAGKTTMVKLLMRFYDVDGGAIRVDGKDVRDIERGTLRQSFGMVLQDAWLFSGTIMENIRYGRLDATDEEVIEAAKAAHADHFIRTLPGGYQMELNEQAENISQGQRQLLTIARAFLADNPIMILDEATSNVDTLTEQRIQQAMQRLMEGRSSFVIAHRLSTIREADLILVMQDGDIKEQGKHEELLERGGIYAELYSSQFENLD